MKHLRRLIRSPFLRFWPRPPKLFLEVTAAALGAAAADWSWENSMCGLLSRKPQLRLECPLIGAVGAPKAEGVLGVCGHDRFHTVAETKAANVYRPPLAALFTKRKSHISKPPSPEQPTRVSRFA